MNRTNARAYAGAALGAARRLLTLLTVCSGLAAVCGTAHAISFVQANSYDPSPDQSTVAVAFSSAQTAGNLNVIAIGWSDSTHTVASVTDSVGNNYVPANSVALSGGARSQAIYYAKNILSASAGGNTVTVTFSGAAPSVDLRVIEYSGLDTASPLDTALGATGTGISLNSGAITTTNANDLLFYADDVETEINQDEAGFTQRLYTRDGGTVADQIVTSTGSYSATATQTGSGMWAMQIVAFKAAGSGGGDTQSPTAPSDLSATASSSGQINLTWTASTDNVGVSGYRVERCQGTSCSSFTQVATPTGTSYSDTGLSASTSYSYRVRATDAAGNLSGYSNTASATTQAGGTSGIAFVQANSYDPSPDQSTAAVTFSSAQTAGNLNVVAIGWSDSTHTVVTVTDSAGNNYVPANSVALSGGARSQAIYYAKNILSASAGGNTVTVTFSGAAPSVDLRVIEYSGLDTASPLDTALGATGTGISLTSGAITTANANDLLFYADDVETEISQDEAGFTQRLYTRDGGTVADDIVTSTGSYSATATQSGSGMWAMQIAAFKAAGSGGEDTQPPTAPTNLSATPVSSGQINLSWTASTDNVGVTGYRVERCQGSGCSNFAQVGTPTGTTFSDTGLTASTAYSYRVRATDAAGNLSAYSATASATTGAAGDTTPPTAPSGLSATAGGSVASLTWTASTDNVGVTGYYIERCQGAGCSTFTQVGTANGVAYTDTGLTPSTTYNYRVRATDAAGNLSTYSNTATTTTTAGLTAPSGLIVVAAASSEVDLAWSGATGGSGTISYLLERCSGVSCSSFAQIGAPSGSAYNDSGRSATTSYSYRVRATDSAGDLGPYSNVATYTTPAATADCSK